MVTKKINEAILRTLIYAYIFRFSLNEEELWQRLIRPPKISRKVFRQKLRALVGKKIISEKEGYYSLTSHNRDLSRRPKINGLWQEKIKIASRAANLLAKIPPVKAILLTGSLAAKNAKPDDDIDLMVITAADTLWTTRLLSFLWLKTAGRILGLKLRKPREIQPKNKICLNLFLDETNLGLAKKEQNLFSAYQVALALPLVNKKKAYGRFLAANRWTLSCLPHAFSLPTKQKQRFKSSWWQQQINRCCFYFQKWYMKGKPTAKKITFRQAFFHPQDLTKVVLKKYRYWCQKEDVCSPLDKNVTHP